jgi:hypothetical protein
LPDDLAVGLAFGFFLCLAVVAGMLVLLLLTRD